MSDLAGELAPDRRRMIDHLGRMIAAGEDDAAVEAAWAELVRDVAVRSEAVDVDAIVQAVTRESYLRTADELSFRASEATQSVADDFTRERLSRLHATDIRAALDDQVRDLERQVAAARSPDDQAILELQDAMIRQSELMSAMSNIQKRMHDTAMAIIRNMK